MANNDIELNEVDNGIRLVEHEGKMYFSDEADKGGFTHEVIIPE